MVEVLDGPAVPLLTRFSTPRTRGTEAAGRYDESLSMWVVDGVGGPMPIIEVGHRVEALATKTFANEEGDDEIGNELLLEGVTRSNNTNEQDDESEIGGLAELETKTGAEIEQDDQSDPLL